MDMRVKGVLYRTMGHIRTGLPTGGAIAQSAELVGRIEGGRKMADIRTESLNRHNWVYRFEGSTIL